MKTSDLILSDKNINNTQSTIDISIQNKIQKDLLELENLCLELGKYVQEQDEYISKVDNDVQGINSMILDSESNINICEKEKNKNKTKVLYSIGIGTIVGLISTGSFFIAPIAGITTGYFGYKILN